MKRGDGAFGHALARRRATSSTDLRLLAPAVVAWVVAAATLVIGLVFLPETFKRSLLETEMEAEPART